MKRMTRLVVLVLLLGVTTPAAAGLYEDAATAHTRGDHQMALRILLPLAAHGDAGAQFNLALIHREGNGVPQNNAEALK